MTSPPSKFRVAIIGAGLGGIILALFLQKHSEDIDIDIYEAAQELTDVGAGIGMWPRNWNVMRHLGLEDELLEIIGNPKGGVNMCLRKGDEAQVVDFVRFTSAFLTFRRSDMRRIFASKLQSGDRIQYSKRLESYLEPETSGEPIVLKFADGTTATCDLLVGSDGIRSVVRRSMFTGPATGGNDSERAFAEPAWSGQIAYRGLVTANNLSEDVLRYVHEPSVFFGKHTSIVSYPISRGEIINVVAYVNTPGGQGTRYDGPWMAEISPEDVAKAFSSWNPHIQELLKSLERPQAWAVHTVPALPTFVKGRVVLLGDSAHAMSPYLGAGAGQAFEEACILATVLAHPSVTAKNLSLAVAVYDEVCRPFAQGVQRQSDRNGSLYQLRGPGWEDVTKEQSRIGGFPRERLLGVAQGLQDGLGWLLKGSILDDREDVNRRVSERLSQS